MMTIETMITVLPDGSIKISTHTGLPPGEHRAVLVVDPRLAERAPALPLRLKMLEMPGWPVDARFRREELYDDER